MVACIVLHPGTVDTDLSKPFQKVSQGLPQQRQMAFGTFVCSRPHRLPDLIIHVQVGSVCLDEK